MVHAVLLALFAQDLEKPVRIEGIDADIGHAAPYLYDIDRDGKRDLLVGQFGEGKMRIYGGEKPDRLEWFKAGGEVATTPAG